MRVIISSPKDLKMQIEWLLDQVATQTQAQKVDETNILRG